MPVLSEHRYPSMGSGGSHQATTNPPSTSSSHLFISLAILLTLGIAFSLRKRSPHANSESCRPFISRRKDLYARIMQEPTPPTSASSALPEKPYLPNPDAMEHSSQATRVASNHEHEKSDQEEDEEEEFAPEPEPFYSPQLQHFPPSDEKLHNVIVQAKAMQQHQPPPFHTRLGSLPAVTTSLLHPELPSPTISVAAAKIQTYVPTQDQNQFLNQNENQNSAQNTYHQTSTTPTQSQYQPYIQNEILFVPSPTEYTSFEALYSKFPPSPPIYHGPNPASYASTTFSEVESSAVPRRRSYIKTLSNGSEMSGEVMEAAGQWRRHTRVFGGAVCIACEESERRMTA